MLTWAWRRFRHHCLGCQGVRDRGNDLVTMVVEEVIRGLSGASWSSYGLRSYSGRWVGLRCKWICRCGLSGLGRWVVKCKSEVVYVCCVAGLKEWIKRLRLIVQWICIGGCSALRRWVVREILIREWVCIGVNGNGPRWWRGWFNNVIQVFEWEYALVKNYISW